MSKLVLIDGNAIMHRAYHALPPLTTKNGEPINAVYGFVSVLLRIIKDLKPTHIAVCFDRPEKTFRKEKYVHYQAQRPEMDEFLSTQITKMHDVLDAFSIPVYEKAGYEADDVIGTLAKRVTEIPKSPPRRQVGKLQITNKTNKKKSLTLSPSRHFIPIDEVVIITGDRDIFQLIDKKIKVYVPVKGLKEGKIYDIDEVKHEFDFNPIQMIDYKALVGDASDNYPGVSGIGPKTARDLIVKYNTVENLFKHLKDLPEGVKNKLKDKKGDALFFKNIATIVTNVPVDIDVKRMGNWDIGSEGAVKLFINYGFKTLLTRIFNDGSVVVSDDVEEIKKDKNKKNEETRQSSLF